MFRLIYVNDKFIFVEVMNWTFLGSRDLFICNLFLKRKTYSNRTYVSFIRDLIKNRVIFKCKVILSAHMIQTLRIIVHNTYYYNTTIAVIKCNGRDK